MFTIALLKWDHITRLPKEEIFINGKPNSCCMSVCYSLVKRHISIGNNTTIQLDIYWMVHLVCVASPFPKARITSL